MHAIGVCLGLIVRDDRRIASILAYVIGLVTMLALSAAYNICLARQVGSTPLRPLRDESLGIFAASFEDMSMTSPTWRALGQVVLVYFAVGGAAVTAQDTQPGRATFAEMIAFARLASVPCQRLAPDADSFHVLALRRLIKPPITATGSPVNTNCPKSTDIRSIPASKT